MHQVPPDSMTWAVTGLLFENCNCQLVCPGHVSFRQLCTHERCIGHWCIHVAEGRFGAVSLDGMNAIVLFDSPQHMYSGNWTQAFLLDERADEAQRQALETILSGGAGGPWSVLDRFVATRVPTRRVPIRFEDEGRTKRMWVDGIFETTVKAIRGSDRSGEATLENLFNQIHGSRQVLALGTSTCQAVEMPFRNEETHGLYSSFSWQGQVA